MPESPSPPTESSDPSAGRTGRKTWQLGVRTIILLLAVIAVWMTFFINRRRIATLESRIKAMRPLARELVVDDPSKIAVVKMEELWYDENRWEIYLPEGRYRVCVATRGIDENGLAEVVKSVPVAAGTHRIELELGRDREVWRVAVTCDGKELLAVEEPEDWNPGIGSSGGGQFSLNNQLAPDKPVVLFRRRFMHRVSKTQSRTPRGPTEGVLMWIEQVSGSGGEPSAPAPADPRSVPPPPHRTAR